MLKALTQANNRICVLKKQLRYETEKNHINDYMTKYAEKVGAVLLQNKGLVSIILKNKIRNLLLISLIKIIFSAIWK